MFCSNCGTKLPDNAHFCSSCGKPIAEKPRTDNWLDQMSTDELEGLVSKTSKAVQFFEDLPKSFLEGAASLIKIAQNGSVEQHHFEQANIVRREFENVTTRHNVPNLLESQLGKVLRFYAISKEMDAFFYNKRWGVGATGHCDRTKLKDDWKLYIDKGLEGLLAIYPHLSLADRQYFVSDLKGLANWVEDELVYHLISTMRAEKIRISDPELDYVMWHRITVERMGTIVARIKELEERVERLKKG